MIELGEGTAPDVEMVQEMLAIIPDGMRNDEALATLAAAVGTAILSMVSYRREPAVLAGVLVAKYLSRMIEMNTPSPEERERAN